MNQKLVANLRIRIIPNQVVRIRRSLPGKSKISAQIRAEVKPDDIIGHYLNSGGFSVINIPKNLGISPSEGQRYLQKKIGDHIFQGELLAEKKQLLGQKVVTSPTDGVLESYDLKTGNLRLNFLSKDSNVTAGVYGIVEEIDSNANEVIIKTLATQIFGIVGSGKKRSGVLSFIKGSHLVQKNQITEDFKSHVLVGQALIYTDAIKKAMSLGVSGIITGGIQLDTFEAIAGSLSFHQNIGEDVGISLVITEGFGPISCGEDILETLKPYEGRYILINGNIAQIILPSTSPDSILTIRKTALPNLKAATEISPEITTKDIETGHRARVIWPPFMGVQGKIIGIDQTPSMLSSGISTYLVTLETNNKKIKVPYTNIELI